MSGHKVHEGYPATLWLSVGGALLGSLQYGYQVGVLNTALPYVVGDLKYRNEAILSSAVVLGAAFGAIAAGTIADYLGPKTAQLLNAGVFGAGIAGTAFSPYGIWGFLAGRLLCGFGAGAASLYTPRYIAEISPTSLRGGLGAQHQVFINVGILLAYMMGMPYEQDLTYVTAFGYEFQWWRVMMVVHVLPLVTQVGVLLCCPESPVWLEGVDGERADKSCIRLWGMHAIVPDQDSETQSISALLNGEEEHVRRQEGWLALGKPQYRWMMALALGLPVLQQASGINTVIYYSSQVFQKAGLESPILGSILMGLVNVLFTLVAASLMDRMGRRPLLLLSYGGMAACLLGVAVTIFAPTPVALQGFITAALIMLYVTCFAFGCGPVPFLYLSEILPDRIKGKAAALGTMLCWVGNLVVTLTFETALHALGLGGAYLLYALLNAGSIWFVYNNMVETKCRTLPEIETLLLLPEEH